MREFYTLNVTQKRLVLLTLASFAFLYFISSAGINCSNDGSHFALAKSIFHNQSTEIKPFFSYVKCCDYAEKDGKIYSDRLPGNALLMLPFLAYAHLLDFAGLKNLTTLYEPDVVAVSLLPNICALLCLIVLFLMFRQSGFNFNYAYIATVVFGLTTLHWLEATHAFSHMPSSFFVLLVIYLIFRVKDISKDQNIIFYAVAAIGFSTLIELQNVLFLLPVAVFLALSMTHEDFQNYKKWFPVLGISILIITFFIANLVFYNYLAFGEFLLKSNAYNPNFPEEKSFATALEGDFLSGLDKLLTSFSNIPAYYNWASGRGNDIPGLFVSSPILFVSLYGFVLFYKKEKTKAILFISMITISILIAAFHKTTLTRHIFTITPFFFFPFIYGLKEAWESEKYKSASIFFISTLTLISFLRQFYITATFWGHGGRDFPKFRMELPFFFAFYIPLCAVIFLWYQSQNNFYFFRRLYCILLISKMVQPSLPDVRENENP